MIARAPSAGDHDVLTAMLERSGVFRPEEIAVAKELLDASMARALGKPDADTYEALVAADEHGRAVGWVCFGATPMTEATYDLYWIVVDADCRGRGVGAQLMIAVEGELRRRGAVNLRIETSSLEGQGGARRFYLKSGYQQAGFIRDFYRAGDDLLIFLKRLATP